MFMWNLVGHEVKLALRVLDAFSRSDAGKKTVEVEVVASEQVASTCGAR